MSAVTRLQPKRRVTKCGEGRSDGWGCGIPLALEWVEERSGMCRACADLKATADALPVNQGDWKL